MKVIGNYGKLILAAVLFCAAVEAWGQANMISDIVTVFLDQSWIGADRAQEICEAETTGQETPASVCFWSERENVPISCKETGQSSFVTDITVTGNTNLVIPGSDILVWQPKGCLMDTASAEELFGTANASGQTVWRQDQAYTVCGTFESMQKLLLRHAENTDAEDLNRISLRFMEGGSRRDELSQFLMRYGLFGESVDLQNLVVLTGDLCLLCPLAAAIKLISEFAKSRKKSGMVLAVAVAGLAAVFLWRFVRIPPEMMPPKWSDFRFWETWRKEQSRNLLLLFGSALGENQLAVLSAMLRSAVCSLLACFLVVI